MLTFNNFRGSKIATVVFSHMNPPCDEHKGLIEYTENLSMSNGSDGSFNIFLSSVTSDFYPLSFEAKLKFARKMFPTYGRNFVSESFAKDPIDILHYLYNEGFNVINFVMEGKPGISKTKNLLEYANGKEELLEKRYYKFDVLTIDIYPHPINPGRLLEYVYSNNFKEFSSKLPKEFLPEARKYFGLLKIATHKSQYPSVEIEKVSEVREQYIKGELFKVDDTVIIKDSKEKGKIQRLGSNYVIVLKEDGTTSRQWLDGVIKEGSVTSYKEFVKRKQEQDRNKNRDTKNKLFNALDIPSSVNRGRSFVRWENINRNSAGKKTGQLIKLLESFSKNKSGSLLYSFSHNTISKTEARVGLVGSSRRNTPLKPNSSKISIELDICVSSGKDLLNSLTTVEDFCIYDVYINYESIKNRLQSFGMEFPFRAEDGEWRFAAKSAVSAYEMGLNRLRNIIISTLTKAGYD